MSNDEPVLSRTEAVGRVEPARPVRLATDGVMPAQPVERLLPAEEITPALRVGTVATDGVPAEPLQQARSMERQAEPLQQARLFDPVPAEPVLSRTEGVPAEPMLSRTEGVPAERMRDGIAARSAEDGVPLEPLRRMSATTPAQQAQPLTATDAVKRTGTSAGGGGSAGQGFQVHPEQYQAAVSPMLAASEQVRSIYTSLSAFLPSLEAQNPWGNDDSGKKFAEGDKGYLKYSKDTLDVIKGLPDALKGIADGMKAMAEGYEGADEAIADAFNGMDTGANPIPEAPSLPSAPVNNPVHIPVTPRIVQSGRH
ncbi:hypothetical protein [Kitasatospora sp. NPDC094015]|uniref:WXG100 family type VII secretion target n=1 Tax=Kitasatospora sp. NPDC094015 TaxID=3155205 RepID=UPI003318D8B6